MKYILIVEDDPLVSATVAEMLQDEGHRTSSASTSAAAGEVLQNGAIPDAILVDLELNGERGQPLVPVAEQRGIPVILMSGYPEAILSYDRGTRPFLAKPFGQSDLLAALEGVFTRASAAGKPE
jgi:DNA-binding response OmpR family regulator